MEEDIPFTVNYTVLTVRQIDKQMTHISLTWARMLQRCMSYVSVMFQSDVTDLKLLSYTIGC